jgi:hypothetical protein
MDSDSKDRLPTIAAIALLAYVCADIAHHMLGHGVACLLEGGQLHLLSSIFVNCSLTGSAIDLAGPLANLALGLIAALVTHVVPRRATAARLYCILLAAFNLLWFAMQLVFSAMTRTDDWAWPMRELHTAEPARYGMIAIGALLYVSTVRWIGSELAGFAHQRARARIIVNTSWLTAGAIACATAALDHQPVEAILRHALPQSMLTSSGLLFTPKRAGLLSSARAAQAVLGLSMPWIVAAAVAGAASVVWLGPGLAGAR